MTEIEICIESVESAIAAERGGAQRIELCTQLDQGGITPDAVLMRDVRRVVSIPVFVIIRPRGGDFLYSDREFDRMSQEIVTAKALGMDGVVLGILDADRNVDVARTRRLVQFARPLQVTFHRAFDASADLDRSLEDVVACGADRLLTSGGQPNAILGAGCIARLQAGARSRISIMAGAGIRQENVIGLVRQTGVPAVHSSLRPNQPVADLRSADCPAGPGSGSPYIIPEHDVRALRLVLDSLVESDAADQSKSPAYTLACK